MRKLTGNKKGIDTILAALLMVVIVVVASVMVYAWSTGLLSSLLVQNPVPKESMNVESFTYSPNNTVVSLSVRNTGSVSLAFASYYVKDQTSGNQIARTSWSTGSISPNGVLTLNIQIGNSCGSSCTGGGSFTQFNGGFNYQVTLVSTRNNQFSWQGQR